MVPRSRTGPIAQFHGCQKAFANASIAGTERVGFNIKGNGYRLVGAIVYQRQEVFIKWLGSYDAYERRMIRLIPPDPIEAIKFRLEQACLDRRAS